MARVCCADRRDTTSAHDTSSTTRSVPDPPGVSSATAATHATRNAATCRDSRSTASNDSIAGPNTATSRARSTAPGPVAGGRARITSTKGVHTEFGRIDEPAVPIPHRQRNL